MAGAARIEYEAKEDVRDGNVPEPGTQPHWLLRGRVPGLDGLRAAAIALVLLAHAGQTHNFPYSPVLKAICKIATIGVDISFVVSGFLITLILIREEDRSGTVSLKEFYRRRALRIFPTYIAYVLAVFICSKVGTVYVSPVEWFGLSTYTVNFLSHPVWIIGHIWSLSIEEQFYLIWPLAILLLSKRTALRACLVYYLAAPILRMAVYLFWPRQLISVDSWTPTRMDSIAAGCALALLATSPVWSERLKLSGRTAMHLSIISIGVLSASVSFVNSDIRGATLYHMLFGYSVKALCIGSLVWSVVNLDTESRVARLLRSRPVAAVGVLSYSLYIWQQLFLNPHNDSWATNWPVNLALVVIVAILSHQLIERPFLKIKASVARRTQPTLDLQTGTQASPTSS